MSDFATDLGADFAEGLIDYADQDEVEAYISDEAGATTHRLGEGAGVERKLFGRGGFDDPQTKFGKALALFEGNGVDPRDLDPFAEIVENLRSYLGLDVEYQAVYRDAKPRIYSPERDHGLRKIQITSLIVVHRGNLRELLVDYLEIGVSPEEQEEAASHVARQENLDHAITSAIEGEGSRTVIPFERFRPR